MKAIMLMALVFGAMVSGAQTVFEDLEFENKNLSGAYKPSGKNHVFIRSKRGNSGVNKSEKADSVAALQVTQIELVYTEMDAAAKAEREQANKERWENLLMTYPEYFEYSPVTINLCQCNQAGDAEEFKKVQGFYVYFASDEEPAAEEPKAVEVAVTKNEPEPRGEEPVAKTEKKKENREESRKEEPRKEAPAEEPPLKKEKKSKKGEDDGMPSMDVPVAKKAPVKKATYTKPRKALDPKACRSACYGYGDEDLNAYFRENITLSKKQKKKGKDLMATINLQLNLDGSIKKVMVTGPNQDFNKQVQAAAEGMGSWNPTVKNGLTIKSNVKITLKFDRETKSMKPFEVMVTPRQAPKCVCVSDEEMFGS